MTALYLHNRVPPPPLAAEAESKIEPFALSDGLQMVVGMPTAAAIESTNSEPYVLSDGDTLKVEVDDRTEQTLALTGLTPGAATAAQIAQSLSLAIKQVSLSATTKVRLSSQTLGASSFIKITGGTAMPILGLDGSDHLGADNDETVTFATGSFVDIADATAAEVDAVFTAQLTGATSRLTIDSNRVRLSTPSPRLLCRGEGAKALGMATEAQVISGNEEHFALEPDMTLSVKVDDGLAQTITFYAASFYDIATATAEEVSEAINDQLTGATATSTDTQVIITSDTTDGPCAVQVTGGTANAIIGFPTDIQWASGQNDQVLAQAHDDDPVTFMLLDSGTAGFDDCQVWVTTNFVRTQVYDSNGPTLAPGWSVTQAQSTSPGATNPDIWTISLAHTAPLVSDELVTVQVQAATLTPDTVDETYTFEAEDTRHPTVEQIRFTDRRTMRIKFSEAMNQLAPQSGDTTSALFTKDVSGRISYHSSITIGVSTFFNVIQAPTGSFTSEHLGLFIGSAAAQNSRNNGTFTIIEVLNDTMVRVDATLTNEDPVDLTRFKGPTVVISPYRLIAPVSSDSVITPAFTPIVLEATTVPQTAIPSYEDPEGYVFLHLHDDPTPNMVYQLELVRIADLAGNEIGSTYSFTSWLVQTPPGRSFDVWDSMIPEYNKEQDTTRDLERVMRCIDEVSKVCLDDVDRFGQMLDPFFTPDHILDTLLKHLGNPFAFAYDLSSDRKRDLISVLVAMYKKKGTDKGIQDITRFFIGKTVTVKDWYIPTDTWTLGESELGYDTYLGPSLSFVRYAFYLEHADALSNEDKDLIRQIVAFVRPAHTHFIGFMQL